MLCTWSLSPPWSRGPVLQRTAGTPGTSLWHWARQTRLVCRSAPPNTLHSWTGRVWASLRWIWRLEETCRGLRSLTPPTAGRLPTWALIQTGSILQHPLWPQWERHTPSYSVWLKGSWPIRLTFTFIFLFLNYLFLIQFSTVMGYITFRGLHTKIQIVCHYILEVEINTVWVTKYRHENPTDRRH